MEAWQEAVAQIHRYAEGEKVRVMCADTELHLIIMQIRGCDLIRMEKV